MSSTHADMNTQANSPHQLKRSIGLWLLCFYGLGNILGAGIYILIGKVAAVAGYQLLIAFFLAGTVAAFTALSYAELASRYPVAAGVAVYLQEGFRCRPLSTIAGVLIAMAGMLSAATILKGFTGYALQFMPWSAEMILFVALSALVVLAIWGVTESVMVAAILTVLEVIGLMIIVFLGAGEWQHVLDILHAMTQFSGEESISSIVPGILLGALLAFYAFIGFEDMVNLSEEVKSPEHTMPRAIIIALIISTLIYAAVAVSALTIMSPDALGKSEAPLADVYRTATGDTPWLISAISLTAVVNGALIQIIMASRVFYGMGRRKWLPRILATIHPRTRTPVTATILVGMIILLFAWFIPLVQLASYTSQLVLIIFLLVNLALIRIKQEEKKVLQTHLEDQTEGIRFSMIIPILGVIGSVLLFVGSLITK